LVPDLYVGAWLEYKRRKRRTSGYGPRFIARHFSAPSISFLSQEALTIALVLASWFVFTDLPRRSPSKPPDTSHEYLRSEKLVKMAEMGIALPRSFARYTPKTRHTVDYLRLRHHYEQAVHYLIVKPCQFLFDIRREPNPLSTPAWPAPALDYLLDSGFNQAPPTCYTDDTYQFEVTCDPDDAGLPQFFSPVVDAADQHTINILHLADEALSLHDAGYRFSFDFTSTAKVLYSSKLPKYWTAFYARMKELEVNASPVSWSTASSDFLLASFSPAEAAKAALGDWMFSFSKGYVSVDLSRRFACVYPTYLFNVKKQHVPLIIDSGASVCVTPEKADFKPGSYRPSNMKVRDLSSGENKVLGEGLVHWPVKDERGNTHVIEIFCIHIPSAGVRLLSPQVLKRTHNIGGSIDDDGIRLSSKDVSMFAPYSSISNLPELQLVDMPKTSSAWSDAFSDISPQHTTKADSVYLTVIDPGNTNLSPSEKELTCGISVFPTPTCRKSNSCARSVNGFVSPLNLRMGLSPMLSFRASMMLRLVSRPNKSSVPRAVWASRLVVPTKLPVQLCSTKKCALKSTIRLLATASPVITMSPPFVVVLSRGMA
jgi:hypothetical protein